MLPPGQPAPGFCGGCKRPIVWIKTTAGKPMICDPELVRGSGKLGEILMLDNGVLVRNPHHNQIGRVPHWATCPVADRFKKPKENKTDELKQNDRAVTER